MANDCFMKKKDVFRQAGGVVRVELPRDYSGNSRGFAIVLMETLEDAQKAFGRFLL